VEAASVPAGNDGGTGEQPGAPSESQGIDFSPVLDRVNEIGQQVGSFAERLEALQSPAEPDQGPDTGGYEDDPSLGMPPDDVYDDPQKAQQWLDNLVQERASRVADERVQQAIEPLVQQLDDFTMEREAKQFATEFPDIAGDEQRAEQFMQHAESLVEQLGVPDAVAAKLVSSGSFLRIVAQAARHEEAGRQEVPADQAREPQLEPAGGANLGGGEPNLAQQIVNARPGGGFWTGG
jgi:hypothetical protein